MSLKEKAVKGVVWSLIQRWGSQAISFLVFLLLARLLNPEAFGLVALSGVFLGFVQVFTDQGLSQAIVQRRDLEPGHLDTAFWVNIIFGAALTGFGIACSGLVAAFFKEPDLAPVICWLSLSFLISGLNSVQSAILTRELNFKVIAVRSLIGSLTGGITGVVMALMGYGVWSLVGRQLSDAVIGVAVLWQVSKWRPGFRISMRHFKELFSYGINVVGINLLNFVNRRSDDFLIGYFLGSVALGYYTVAYRILLIVTEVMIGTVQKMALPVFSRLQAEPERLREAFYSAIQITSLVAFPAFLGLSALAPELVVVVFGEQWLPSIPVMQILGLIGLLYAGFYYNGPLIMAMGKPGWSLALNCLQAVGNVIFFLIAVRWGIVAVAAAYVIRGYLIAPIAVWVVNQVLPLNLMRYLRQYAGPLVASLTMVAAIFLTRHLLSEGGISVVILLPVYITIGIAVYVATILLVAPKLSRRAIDLVRSALPKPKFKRT
jgi:PST family polysaccharide transporter